jgi:hypothetical protein
LETPPQVEVVARQLEAPELTASLIDLNARQQAGNDR